MTFSMKIKWGDDPHEQQEMDYIFKTQDELDAFLYGVGEGVGWEHFEYCDSDLNKYLDKKQDPTNVTPLNDALKQWAEAFRLNAHLGACPHSEDIAEILEGAIKPLESCADCGSEDASPCPEFDKVMCDDCYTEARVTVAHEEGLDTMIEVDSYLQQRMKEASQ